MVFMMWEWDNVYTRGLALVIFVTAALTDLYDGRLARRYGQTTTFGKFMDPLADKLIISAALVSFVQLDEIHVPAWMVVFIISREFLITGLRSVAASRGVVIPAGPEGKFKTTSQITTIITTLVILIINSAVADAVSPDMHSREVAGYLIRNYTDWHRVVGFSLRLVPYGMVFLTMLLTLYSGVSYIRQHLALIRDEL